MSKNIQQLTKEDLETTLEKALEKQGKVILGAVDSSFKEVKEDISELKTSVTKLKTSVTKLETNVTKLENNDKRSLDIQDKICKQLTDLKQEGKMGTKLYKHHDKKIEKHEKRISKLELNIQQISHK